MKKFEQLGRNLSKEQMKKVMGGTNTVDDGGDGCDTACTTVLDCPLKYQCSMSSLGCKQCFPA